MKNRKTSTKSCQSSEWFSRTSLSWPLDPTFLWYSGRYRNSDSEYFQKLLNLSGVWCKLCFLCDQLQSFPNQPHYLTGFEVLYRSLLPISSDWTATKVTLPRFQAQVGPLKRGFKYEFKVRPYGSNLYGRESNTKLLRVPEKGEEDCVWKLQCVFFL